MGCTESVEENVQDNRKTGYQFNTNNQQFNQQNVIWNQVKLLNQYYVLTGMLQFISTDNDKNFVPER